MVKSTHYKTSQDWLEQSASLLRARPTTTRITTKYSIKRSTPSQRALAAGTTPTKRAFLTLKTFDPTSGATLKFKTTKAAEVSRLISALGMLGRDMAGLEPVNLSKGGVEVEESGGEKKESVVAGGKKKKKGKK